MKDADVLRAIEITAEDVRSRCGFGENMRLADELVRLAANTNLAPRLFAAWLRRTPEAAAFFMDELDKLDGDGYRRTRPPSPEWDTRETGLPVAHADFAPPAQKSEPKPNPVESVLFPTTVKADGRKGASAEPVVVNIGNAASVLGRASVQTRRVDSGDLMELGDVPPMRGQEPICGLNNRPLTAVAKFRDHERIVEFLDKRGPLLMMRVSTGRDKGQIVTGSIKFIDPKSRAEVLAVLNRLPGAADEFNFDPYAEDSDPWAFHVSPSTEPDPQGVPFETESPAVDFGRPPEIEIPVKRDTVADAPPDGDYEPRDHG